MDDYERTDPKFDMGEPFAIEGWGERFAFRFSASEPYLIEFVRSLACVADVYDVHPMDDEERCLVEIDNEFDPDEAWHWIRTELEDEVNNSGLDALWREAIWLL